MSAHLRAELEAVGAGVVVRRLGLRTVQIQGPDRQSWLNGLVTCNLAKLGPGDAVYGLIVAKNGKIQSELYAHLGAEDLLFGVQASKAEELVTTLDRYLVMEDAELAMSPADEEWLLLLGPRVGDALAIAQERGARGAPLTRGTLAAAAVACPRERTGEVNAAILAQCAPASLATDAGWNDVRVQYGIPEYGVDFDDSNYPQEAALERDGVSFDKGCYLGQEAVFMLEKRGHVKKRLVQLQLEAPAAVGDAITTPDGTNVGNVTTFANPGGRNVALGYVKYKHAREGSELLAGSAHATVSALLAIRPED